MKTLFVHTLSVVALASVSLARAQGTFQDLNFEEANIVPIVGSQYYPYAVTVANALPGWTVDYGNVQQSQILYNDPSLGGTAVTLLAEGYPPGNYTAIDGSFSVVLQGGLNMNLQPTAAKISQTGQIPAGTQSLLFECASDFSPNEPPEVLIGNDELTLFPIRNGTVGGEGYTIFGGNISAWAGQTEQLTLSAPSGNFIIDDISFSTSVVPEPSPPVMTGIGGFLFALYRRCAPNRRG